MVKIGSLARFFNKYEDEVLFAKENNFDFMQLWYDNRGISLSTDEEDPIYLINKYNFPTIIHAVLNVDEFEEHIPKLIKILKEINHKDLIVHPICKTILIDETTLDLLNTKIGFALDLLNKEGITLYLENNNKLDPMFTNSEEIEKIFESNKDLEFILDVAHIDNLKHLEEMVKIKMPKILHVADKHFDVIHEHLPIGHGELDFKYIFNNILKDFDGRIILEIVNTDLDIVNSKNIISNIVNK